MSWSQREPTSSPAASSDKIFAEFVDAFDPRRPLSSPQIRMLKKIPHLVSAAFRLAASGTDEQARKSEIILNQLELIESPRSQQEAPPSNDAETESTANENDIDNANDDGDDDEDIDGLFAQPPSANSSNWQSDPPVFQSCWRPGIETLYPRRDTDTTQSVNRTGYNNSGRGLINQGNDKVTVQMGSFFNGIPPEVMARHAARVRREEERRLANQFSGRGYGGYDDEGERRRPRPNHYGPVRRQDSEYRAFDEQARQARWGPY